MSFRQVAPLRLFCSSLQAGRAFPGSLEIAVANAEYESGKARRLLANKRSRARVQHGIVLLRQGREELASTSFSELFTHAMLQCIRVGTSKFILSVAVVIRVGDGNLGVVGENLALAYAPLGVTLQHRRQDWMISSLDVFVSTATTSHTSIGLRLSVLCTWVWLFEAVNRSCTFA